MYESPRSLHNSKFFTRLDHLAELDIRSNQNNPAAKLTQKNSAIK